MAAIELKIRIREPNRPILNWMIGLNPLRSSGRSSLEVDQVGSDEPETKQPPLKSPRSRASSAPPTE